MTAAALTTHPYDDDKLREECGIFGITGKDSAATLTAEMPPQASVPRIIRVTERESFIEAPIPAPGR